MFDLLPLFWGEGRRVCIELTFSISLLSITGANGQEEKKKTEGNIHSNCLHDGTSVAGTGLDLVAVVQLFIIIHTHVGFQTKCTFVSVFIYIFTCTHSHFSLYRQHFNGYTAVTLP